VGNEQRNHHSPDRLILAGQRPISLDASHGRKGSSEASRDSFNPHESVQGAAHFGGGLHIH